MGKSSIFTYPRIPVTTKMENDDLINCFISFVRVHCIVLLPLLFKILKISVPFVICVGIY
uniref:Uncharacterized protein n=1 Tax=Rhizophora mucronata TaxID=61149 RepID=A0A2P2MVE5_RHIMU